MNQLSTEDRVRIISCLIEGNSQRATCRMTGAAKKTVARLAVEIGEACERRGLSWFGLVGGFRLAAMLQEAKLAFVEEVELVDVTFEAGKEGLEIGVPCGGDGAAQLGQAFSQIRAGHGGSLAESQKVGGRFSHGNQGAEASRSASTARKKARRFLAQRFGRVIASTMFSHFLTLSRARPMAMARTSSAVKVRAIPARL